MATSQVKRLHEQTGAQVFITGRGGRAQWSEVFENNPRISRTPRGCIGLANGPGMRPYIKAKTAERWFWKTWDIAPGEIYLTYEERSFAEAYRGRILVEPNAKIGGGNKSWDFSRWQEVAHAIGPERLLQVGGGQGFRLGGVERAATTFRQACAILSACRLFVGTEGGLHHAAAALGVPAVVLFSEFISPAITGYESHRNLRHADEPCGARIPCDGCKASMDAISVEEVMQNVTELL